MKWVNGAAIALILAMTGCSPKTVPTLDSIGTAYEHSAFEDAREQVRLALAADPENHQLLLFSGKIAVETNNPEYAIGVLQPLTRDSRLGAEARGWLAKAYILAGNPGQALKTLGPASPGDGLSASVGVIAHMMRGEGEEADTLFRASMQRFPQSPDLLALAGDAALRSGDVAQARGLSAKMRRIAPYRVDTQLFAARMAMVDGKANEAIRHLDAVLKARPDHPTALVAKGTILYDQGQRQRAETLFSNAAAKSGEASLVAQYFRARIAFDAGDEATARDLVQAIVDPSLFPPVTRLAGILASHQGEHEQAIRLLRLYLDRAEDAPARLALSVSLAAVGQGKEAWQVLMPAAQNPAASAAILRQAARLSADLGLKEAALYQARLKGVVATDQTVSQLVAAEAALRAGQWRTADGLYAALLRADPATMNKALLNNAAYTRQQLGDFAGAEALARRALAIDPNDPVVQDTTSWILFARYGATPEAVRLSRRARARLGDDPDVRQHGARIEAAARQKLNAPAA